jgi:SAM-dependent methyltransferase
MRGCESHRWNNVPIGSFFHASVTVPAVAREDMEQFWDERAREDAPYYVDNLLEYGQADMDQFWRGGERVVDQIGERLAVEIAPSDEVVEVGAGLGRLTRVLAERARRVWAFDISSEMLHQAKELNNGLANVEWVHGDGTTLQPVGDGAASVCFSFVVFQHVPDAAITYGYVTEMGRVLRAGGWSAFQVSNDPSVHKPRNPSIGTRIKSALGRGPKGQSHPAWLGSAVDLDELKRVADAAGMDVEKVDGAGTQFCLVLLRKR